MNAPDLYYGQVGIYKSQGIRKMAETLTEEQIRTGQTGAPGSDMDPQQTAQDILNRAGGIIGKITGASTMNEINAQVKGSKGIPDYMDAATFAQEIGFDTKGKVGFGVLKMNVGRLPTNNAKVLDAAKQVSELAFEVASGNRSQEELDVTINKLARENKNALGNTGIGAVDKTGAWVKKNVASRASWAVGGGVIAGGYGIIKGFKAAWDATAPKEDASLGARLGAVFLRVPSAIIGGAVYAIGGVVAGFTAGALNLPNMAQRLWNKGKDLASQTGMVNASDPEMRLQQVLKKAAEVGKLAHKEAGSPSAAQGEEQQKSKSQQRTQTTQPEQEEKADLTADEAAKKYLSEAEQQALADLEKQREEAAQKRAELEALRKELAENLTNAGQDPAQDKSVQMLETKLVRLETELAQTEASIQALHDKAAKAAEAESKSTEEAKEPAEAQTPKSWEKMNTEEKIADLEKRGALTELEAKKLLLTVVETGLQSDGLGSESPENKALATRASALKTEIDDLTASGATPEAAAEAPIPAAETEPSAEASAVETNQYSAMFDGIFNDEKLSEIGDAVDKAKSAVNELTKATDDAFTELGNELTPGATPPVPEKGTPKKAAPSPA